MSYYENKVTWNEMAPELRELFNVFKRNIERLGTGNYISEDDLNAEITKRKSEFDRVKNLSGTAGSALGKAMLTGKDGQVIKIDQYNQKLVADDNFRQCRFADGITERSTELGLNPSQYNSYSLDIAKEYICSLYDDTLYKWNGSSYVKDKKLHEYLLNKIWLYNPRSKHFVFYNYWNKYDEIVTKH